MINLAIIEDHTIVIEGIKTLLIEETDMQLIQTFTKMEQALNDLNSSIDILLLDINLPDGNGISACKTFLKKFPNLKIIALTNYEESSFIKQIMQNGALGYLLKNTERKELVEAIHSVLKNQRYLPEGIAQKLINESIGQVNSSYFLPKLTSREKEILHLIVQEFTTGEIAQRLFITPKTVESHRSNLIQKLGVKNTAGLVRVALEKGLI